MITRRNIIDLIGGHRGKYHSCILTCYSFDFSFFEERILPSLRNLNIKNVNVFADGKFLEQAQETTTGHEFKFNKTYNFHPVYTKGVFHPKIMLLVGVKHGLLIIGSGNITSSGLSTNDEIWGAFQLDNANNENSFLFAEVWYYLQQFVNDTYGFIPQKIDWIRKYSPWLADLPNVEGQQLLESLNNYISFVSNSEGNSIFEGLVKLIPSKNLQILTIISPYYDQNGILLSELKSHFQPKVFNCVLDLEYGLSPKDLDEETASIIKFYDWSDCMQDFTQGVTRLHAKIFHFLFSDGAEYVLLGSANATSAALGTTTEGAINHEAGLIIKRISSRKSWIEELGIILPENTVNLNLIKENKNINNQTAHRKPYTARLMYAELRGNELSIYLKNEINLDDGALVLFSRDSLELEQLKYQQTGNKLILKSKIPEDIFKVQLIDSSNNAISNFCIVHRVESLIKCNPDPQQEKLDSLFEQEYPDGEGITELLQYVEYNWADDESDISLKKKGVGFGHNSQGVSHKESYPTLTSEEFNKISDEMFLKQTGEMFDATVKIADFLGILGSELSTKSSEVFEESEELKLLEDFEQRGEGNAVANQKAKRINPLKERDAIIRYFKKLDENYAFHLSSFYQQKALTVTPKININIKALSNVLVGLQLILRFHGKKFINDAKDEKYENDELRQENYLSEGDIFSGHKTIKGFITNVIGKFLILCTAGMKVYDYEILNQKLYHFRKQLVEKLVYTILNSHWREIEDDYRDNILLNSLFFIYPIDSLNQLTERVTQLSLSEYKSKHFEMNMFYFKFNFIPKFSKWLNTYSDPNLKSKLVRESNPLLEGSIIFNSKIGFNIIHKIERRNNFPLICFKRAGYVFDEEKKNFLLNDITYGNKCIAYD